MRILWITNSPFPEVFKKFNDDVPVNIGWVHSAAYSLLNKFDDIQLAVASFYRLNELEKITLGAITHYLIPEKFKNVLNGSGGNKIHYWKTIKDDFYPDVIHIHGSEYPHSLSFVEQCGHENVVLSIQGLVSVCERYYYGGISKKALKKSITIRDIFRRDTVFSQQRNMYQRGEREKELIGEVSHVIGRTFWDQTHVWTLNPNARYHFCNETLRGAFYKNKWDISKCETNSIFISQAYYPLKGLHQLIEALPIVLRHYPETKVYIAGHNFFSNRGIRLHGFGKYINSLISKHKLSPYINFLGLLDEEEMCRRFINSHVFVCPSAIENSPNSVGEAQLLGVPCIASFVGGVADMIEHEKTGLLYRFEEIEMLAAHICRIFSDDKLTCTLSENSRVIAAERHNKEKNATQLFEIYSSIDK